MRAHYHVHTGMRGYVPNSTYYASTRKEAEAIAQQEARVWEECFLSSGILGFPLDPRGEGRTRMVGSARSGWYEGPGDLSFHYIQIVPCTDDCDPEEEPW